MNRSIASFALVLSLVCVPTFARAEKRPVRVAATDSVVDETADRRDDTPLDRDDVETARERRGFSLDVGMPLLVPTGEWGRGVTMNDFGAGSGLELRLAVNPSAHVGVFGGGRATAEHAGAGACHDTRTSSCGGLTYGFPVGVQLTPGDRKRGLYFEFGATLLATYWAFDPGGSLRAQSPIDGRGAIGFRLDRHSFASHVTAPSRWSLDLRFGAEAGQLRTMWLDEGKAQSIPRPAMHVTYEASIGLVWTP